MKKFNKKKKYVTGDKRISSKMMTKYERTKIIGLRASELVYNYNPMVDISDLHNNSPYFVAKKEFDNNKLDSYIIERPMPNGEFELWKVGELIKR